MSVSINGPDDAKHGSGGDRWCQAASWPETDKNVVGVGGVTSDDPDGDGLWGWSQNVCHQVRNVFGVIVDCVWSVTGKKMVGN